MNSKTKTGHEQSALADAVKTVMQKPKAPVRPAVSTPAKPQVKAKTSAAAPAKVVTRPTPAKAATKPVAVTKAAPVKAAASKPAVKPGEVAPAAKIEKTGKPKKTKLVRASYTIPALEYEALSALKARSTRLGMAPKKSELLRAGIAALSALSDAALKTAVGKVEVIKTGRKRKAK